MGSASAVDGYHGRGTGPSHAEGLRLLVDSEVASPALGQSSATGAVTGDRRIEITLVNGTCVRIWQPAPGRSTDHKER